MFTSQQGDDDTITQTQETKMLLQHLVQDFVAIVQVGTSESSSSSKWTLATRHAVWYVLEKCRVVCNVDASRSMVLELGPVRALLPPDASHGKISAFVKWILEDVRSLCKSSCDSRSIGTYLHHHFCSTTLSTALELLHEYVIRPKEHMSKARRLFVAISLAVCKNASSLRDAIPNTKDMSLVLFTSILLACDTKREVRSASWNLLWKLSQGRKRQNKIAFQALELRLDGNLGVLFSLMLFSVDFCTHIQINILL